LSTVGLNDEPDESRQSVTVGNHNMDAITPHCAFQNGFKTFTFEVDLPFKVIPLFVAGQTTDGGLLSLP
jgi:hypothetical protein